MPDLIGFLGVFLVVFSYFSMQLGKLSSKSKLFNILNLLGSIFILFSLIFNFNLPSAVIQIIWIIASLIGLLKKS